MAKLLELDEGYFINQITDKAATFAMINYYPPSSRPDRVIGLRPHSDVHLVTILLIAKNVGGLQVQRRQVIQCSNYSSHPDDFRQRLHGDNEQWDLQERSAQGCDMPRRGSQWVCSMV